MAHPSFPRFWHIRMRLGREFYLISGILAVLLLGSLQAWLSWQRIQQVPVEEKPTIAPIDLTQLEWWAWRGIVPAESLVPQEVQGTWRAADGVVVEEFPISLNHIFEIPPAGMAAAFSSVPVNDFTLATSFDLETVNGLPPLGLRLAELGENWSVYLNGQLLRSEMFRAADGQILVRRSVQGVVVPLPAEAIRPGENVLSFHFSGAAPLTGFLQGWAPGFPVARGFQIGILEQLTSARRVESGLTMAQVGMYLFFGVYEIAFFLRRRQNLEHFFLALYLLFFGAGWLFFNSSLVFDLYPDTTLITRLSYFTTTAAAVILPFLWFFFHSNKTQPTWLIWFEYGLASITSGILILPFSLIEPVLRAFLYTLPLIIAAVLVLTFQARRARLPDSNKILAVAILAGLLTTWDFLDLQILHTGWVFAQLTPFLASFALVIIQTRRFWKLQMESERLNQALRAEQESLEEQVRLRTAELLDEVQERALARQEAEARAVEAETLQKAISAVTGTLEPREMIEQILEQLARVVSFDSASVQLLQDDGTTEVIAGRGLVDLPQVIGLRLPAFPDDISSSVYRTLRPIILKDVTVDYPTFIHPKGMTVRGWMCVPLVARGRPIGHLTLDSLTVDHFTDKAARLALAYVDQVALALQNAEAYQEARQRAGELQMFYEMGLSISSALELQDVLQAVYAQARRIARMDVFYIALFDEASGMVSYPIFEDRGELISVPSETISEQAGLTSWVIAHRQALNLSDTLNLAEGNDIHFAVVGDDIPRSYIGVPMLLRDRVVGVISMQAYPANRFTADQLRLLETMANQAAAAVDNSRLYNQIQEELRLRRQAEDSLRQLNKVLETQLREIGVLQASLQEQAIRDALTGLFNRRYLEETLVRELARAQRDNNPLGVIMMDIDHFKDLNDTYGHKAGDRVLSALGGLLQRISRKSDVACRYGGEELVLILPDVKLEVAQQRAETVRTEFAAMTIQCDAQTLHATISLGVALYPQHGLDPETLLDQADAAMYRAKQAGRNRVFLAV